MDVCVRVQTNAVVVMMMMMTRVMIMKRDPDTNRHCFPPQTFHPRANFGTVMTSTAGAVGIIAVAVVVVRKRRQSSATFSEDEQRQPLVPVIA